MTASDTESDRALVGDRATLHLRELAGLSCLGDQLEQLRGRSAVIVTPDPFTAAILLIELDGVARRMVLCPPDLSPAHFPQIVREAECDAWIGDPSPAAGLGIGTVAVPAPPSATGASRRFTHETEWVLLTSGTTGAPKLVLHTLATLTNAIAGKAPPAPGTVWSTFYDIRRYGGLQILLRGLLGGSLVLSSPRETVSDFLGRAGAAGVTHISGTPSHWRTAMISGATAKINPRYVRLSGEIADQAVLDALRRVFPGAVVAHAFASTEAGVGFEVTDGRSGFPATLLSAPDLPAELDVKEGRLRLRSRGGGLCYLGKDATPLRAADGFVDTGDQLELRDGRYHFMGRSGGVINVGGQKVHPEEVEAVINSLPWVQISRVAARKSPITGAVVVAEVVPSALVTGGGAVPGEETKLAIVEACRQALPAHKVPASIRFVSALEVGPSGKLIRANA
ncbi:MAG TPA: AMP-binding protein [Steroidobacteraceae bacterium]|nr:AMP-binding protein [Steroidobacteraceae bacterium]